MGIKQLKQESRKTKRLNAWIRSLSQEQKSFIKEYASEFWAADLAEMFAAAERVIRVNLLDKFTFKEIDDFITSYFTDMRLEGMKIKELQMKGINYMANIKKENVIALYEELKDKGFNQKEIMLELKTKFPSLTTTTIKNITAEHLKALKLNANDVDEDVKEALEHIFPDASSEEIDEVMGLDEEKQDIEEKDEEDLYANNLGFEVVNKRVVRDLKGEIGVWHIDGNEVTIDGCTFISKETLNDYIDNQIEHLNRCRAEGLKVYSYIEKVS